MANTWSHFSFKLKGLARLRSRRKIRVTAKPAQGFLRRWSKPAKPVFFRLVTLSKGGLLRPPPWCSVFNVQFLTKKGKKVDNIRLRRYNIINAGKEGNSNGESQDKYHAG